ncbi:MAG: outer membrane protein assembly factor BamA [Gammaproteobacteria bacterium]|nr:outer membrane protein assembly factor BamA [Gammaproteobacteria bacterium]
MKKLILLLAATLLTTTTVIAEDFTIRDIRVEGMQRLEEGTVLTYLGINPGETVSRARMSRAIRALYRTELFDDIQFEREGDVLVVRIKERPVISSVDVEGNKAIKDEDIESSLVQSSISKGRPLKKNIVNEIESALKSGYYDQGKYSAEIEAKIKDLGNNTVDIDIEIKEGDYSKIKAINFTGNTVFSDEVLRDLMETKSTNLLSFIRSDDNFSKQTLNGDIETLRSFYLDNGYAEFAIENLQVTISPDKKSIFLTIDVFEGDLYNFGKASLINEGEILSSEGIQKLLDALEGEIFSFGKLEGISEYATTILGNMGYANAEAEPIPTLNKEAKIADFTMLIKPGKKVFVNTVVIEGLSGTYDEVLRRQLRFYEGGPLENVERTKFRLQRLPYVKSAEIDTVPVPGKADRVDVIVKIEPGQPGDFNLSAGYSDTSGLIFGGGFTNTNFFGTGNNVATNVSISDFRKGLSTSYTNPYYTDNGVSRSIGLSYFKSSAFTRSSSDIESENGQLSLIYGYPLSELSSFRFGGSYSVNRLLTSSQSSRQQLEFVTQNGDPFERNVSLFNPFTQSEINIPIFGTDYNNFQLSLGYNYNSLNNYLFATRGQQISANLSGSIPGSDVEFYSAAFQYLRYFPIGNSITLKYTGDFAFAEDYGDTTMLPPSNNLFSSNSVNVRGFRESYLGPRDTNGFPFGGNLRVINSLDLYLPVPEKVKGTMRYSIFADAGGVFYQGNSHLFPRQDVKFDIENFRASAGVSVEWLSPMGLIGLSYGYPLHDFVGDDVERLQFNISQGF